MLPQATNDIGRILSDKHLIMLVLTSPPDKLLEIILQGIYALGSWVFAQNISISPDPPQQKLAAEAGVLSGISYEQPIGGKFSFVGKVGLSLSDEGNPWTYAGFQPSSELGVRWYFAGISPDANNEGSYFSIRAHWAYQRWAFAQAYPKEHNQQSTFNLSLVWGRTWNLSNRWAIKSHLGIGLHNAFVSDLQSWQNGHSDDYHVGNNEGIFCPMDIGLVYRF